jgi:hypothetical protein
MDAYLIHLVGTLRAIFGTQKDYVTGKQNSAIAGAMKPKGSYDVEGFMGAITAAMGTWNKIWDIGLNGENNDDIATLGPSDEHLRKLMDGDSNIGNLPEGCEFPAVYNFGEGATNFKNDAYDKIMKAKGITRKQAVQETAQEAKNNSKAVLSGHYPELYLAWLKSLPDNWINLY